MVHPLPAFLRGPPSLRDSTPRCSPSSWSPLVRSTGLQSSDSQSIPATVAGRNVGDRQSFIEGTEAASDRWIGIGSWTVSRPTRSTAVMHLLPSGRGRKSCDSRDSARIRVVLGTHSHAGPGCPPGWHHADQSAALLILLHPVMSYQGDQESCQRLGGVAPTRWEDLENRSKRNPRHGSGGFPFVSESVGRGSSAESRGLCQGTPIPGTICVMAQGWRSPA